MKKIALFVMTVVIALTSYSQKKKNGTIYIEHPAIDVVEAFHKAFVAGDKVKIAELVSDDFMAWGGSSVNPNDKGTNKEQLLQQVDFWKNNVKYLSITRQEGAFPDALEYKDDDDGIWVQTWDVMKGVHTETGSKINMPIHRIFAMDENNKIKLLIGYYNDEVFANVGRSFDVRENGKVYDQHTFINKVKLGFAAFENADYETAYSLFHEDSKFTSSSMLPGDEPATLEQVKQSNQDFVNTYDVISIDMNGYPDYIHYARGDIHIVQSWWTFRLKRKSDGKKIMLPAFYTHEFDNDGMITQATSYINMKLLDD